MDFEVDRFTRRCYQTDRELVAGERFYSVLVADGADVVRRDYCEQAWTGPPDDALAVWKSSVPDPKSNRPQCAPNEVMLQFFCQTYEDCQQPEFLYVLTLLMIRRRIFRLEASEEDESGRECLVVYCAKKETEYRVAVHPPDETQAAAVQQQIVDLLFGGDQIAGDQIAGDQIAGDQNSQNAKTANDTPSGMQVDSEVGDA